MLSIDTNILLPAVEVNHPSHPKAVAFLNEWHHHKEVAISEFILLELYGLLRNPMVLAKPLSPSKAVDICQRFRCHPRWQMIGLPPGSNRGFYDRFWPKLATRQFARRRAYDWRVALSLLDQGVEQFATVNIKDFQAFGFQRVWNPLA